MKRLAFLVSLLTLVVCFSCKKANEEVKENACENHECPAQDAIKIFDAKNNIANLIKDAIEDKEISDEEAEEINNAFFELHNLDAEVKTKYQNDKDAQNKLFGILNAENNYNKSIKLASELESYTKISAKVK
ncbi:MAG: hypothetical protein HUK15_01615 [Bacteroidales bacterium]|nr:hypothetical protein [Bacteroidales bacterium]